MPNCRVTKRTLCQVVHHLILLLAFFCLLGGYTLPLSNVPPAQLHAVFPLPCCVFLVADSWCGSVLIPCMCLPTLVQLLPLTLQFSDTGTCSPLWMSLYVLRWHSCEAAAHHHKVHLLFHTSVFHARIVPVGFWLLDAPAEGVGLSRANGSFGAWVNSMCTSISSFVYIKSIYFLIIYMSYFE